MTLEKLNRGAAVSVYHELIKSSFVSLVFGGAPNYPDLELLWKDPLKSSVSGGRALFVLALTILSCPSYRLQLHLARVTGCNFLLIFAPELHPL